MQSLYYTSGSGVTQSVLFTSDNLLSNQTWNNAYLTFTASFISGPGSNYTSINYINVVSGGIVQASFPEENTNIYYLTPIIPTTISSSFLINWNFTITSATSSVNNIFAIYSSSLASASIYQTQSSNGGITSLFVNTNYTVLVSGSGQFYTSNILIIDDLLSSTSSYVTASNNPITSSISGSTTLNRYSIYAQVINQPYIKLIYTSSIYPVANTSSLSSWNSYLNISASFLSQSSTNIFYLGGGNLSNITILDGLGQTLSNFDSFGLSNLSTFRSNASSLNNFFDVSTLPSLTTLELYGQLGTSISGSILSLNTSSLVSSSITNISIGNNKISGSINNVLSILPQSIQFIDCSINYLTGSIPILTQSYALSYLDCSYNQLSGSISSLDGNYSLQSFYCNNNRLIGNIPTFTTTSISLQSFDCSNNQLSGSIPSLNNVINLYYFYCNNNYLTGNIPVFTTGSNNLQSFNCNNNKISGSIPSLSLLSKLQSFECNNNYLTGSIPNLTNNTLLTSFDCSNNRLSGSIPNLSSSIIETFYCNNNYLTGSIDLVNSSTLSTFICSNNLLAGNITSLSGCNNLTYFDCQSNPLTGSIPALYNTPVLEQAYFSNNKFSNYVSASGTGYTIPTSLSYLDVRSNLLPQNVIDSILVDFDNAGGTGGYLLLDGTGNSTPSPIGEVALLSLTNKGWTVYTN